MIISKQLLLSENLIHGTFCTSASAEFDFLNKIKYFLIILESGGIFNTNFMLFPCKK